MADSIFRPLVNVLPDAVFEMLQGIGEAAVAEAQSKYDHSALIGSLYPRPSRSSLLVDAINGTRGSLLCERYGWKAVKTWRNAAWPSITFGVRMPCGHKHEFYLGDEVVEMCTPGDAIRQLDKEWSKVRRCYCVPREVRA